jgi:hypothetical protein
MKYSLLIQLLLLSCSCGLAGTKVKAQSPPTVKDSDLDPDRIKNSPVLQRWREEVPNVLEDMRTEPSFPTRVRLGYSQVDDEGGVSVGVEDVFLGRTGLTVSGEYQTSGDRDLWGANLRYYVFPLGNYLNFAPVVGYRNFSTDSYETDGLEVGGKVQFTFSPGGAGDISLAQTFISPTDGDEVGLTTLSVGYAVADHWRLSTDIQHQNSRASKDTRYGILIEWLPN